MLYDAMHDLAPLGDRFGPVAGGHPGVLDPSATPHSVVFGSDFRLNIEAKSNLRWLDGVELAHGKDYMAAVVDVAGPTYDDVLEFDFQDPSRFQVDGLVPAPTVDMRLRMLENGAFIPSCNGNDACQRTSPNRPRAKPRCGPSRAISSNTSSRRRRSTSTTRERSTIATSTFWDARRASRWARAAHQRAGPTSPCCSIWAIPPRTNISGSRSPKWPRWRSTAFPAPPSPRARPTPALPCATFRWGSRPKIRTAIRPYLQDQASFLSSRLLGDYAKNNGLLDFFYRRGSDGVPYLFFAAAGDPRPRPGYAYKHPGFFRDAALTSASKASATNISGSGDTAHEKVMLGAGATVLYVEDETGAIYRLRFDVSPTNTTEITVRVAKKAR